MQRHLHLHCLSILFIVALLSSCASQIKPAVDYDPSARFSDYKSFAFIGEHPLILGQTSRPVSPLTEGRIMKDIENILAARGFRRLADPESADMAISFTLGSRDEIRVDSYPEPYRAGYGRWGGGWGGAYYSYGNRVDVSSYTQGILSIDIYDVREHRPVWHGRATKKITDSVIQNPGPVITEVVSAILSTFPPL